MSWDAIFAGWQPIVRIVVVGIAAYAALIVMLRLSGKRTLSKLNAFDFVVTIALGSTLATVIMSKDVALAEGLTALALLVGVQFAVTWTSVRWRGFDEAIKSEPTVLLRDGVPLPAALRRERVTEEELHAAVRERGGRDVSEAQVILLETDGTLTAILGR